MKVSEVHKNSQKKSQLTGNAARFHSYRTYYQVQSWLGYEKKGSAVMGMEERSGRIVRTHYYDRTACSEKITEINIL